MKIKKIQQKTFDFVAEKKRERFIFESEKHF